MAREYDVRHRSKAPSVSRPAGPAGQNQALLLQRQVGNRAATQVLSRLKIGGVDESIPKLSQRLEDRYGRNAYGQIKTALTELSAKEFTDEAALHTELDKRGLKPMAPSNAPPTPAPKVKTLEEMRQEGVAKVATIWKELDKADIRGVGKRVWAHLLGEQGSDKTADLYWDEAVKEIKNAPKERIKWQDTDSKTGEDTFVIQYSDRPYRSIVFATKTGRNVSVFHIGPGGK